jgi:hypothetical protein
MSEKKTLPERHAEKVFTGKIDLDVRDSKPTDRTVPRLRPRTHRTSCSICG